MTTQTSKISTLKSICADLMSWTTMAAMETAEAIACYPLGQILIKQLDKVVWLVEKSSQWALPPPAQSENKAIIAPQLTRPLPWILFLPLLLFLRLFREGVSIILVMLGGEPIKPTYIVKFLQNTRRYLRAVKYHGIRNIRFRNQNIVDAQETQRIEDNGIREWIEAVINKVMGLMCYQVVRYSNGKQINPLRQNSGEMILPSRNTQSCSKKRPFSPDKNNGTDDINTDEDSDDAQSALQELATTVDLIESESDDSDYLVPDKDADTSITSTDDDDDDDNEETNNSQIKNNTIQSFKSSESGQDKPPLEKIPSSQSSQSEPTTISTSQLAKETPANPIIQPQKTPSKDAELPATQPIKVTQKVQGDQKIQSTQKEPSSQISLGTQNKQTVTQSSTVQEAPSESKPGGEQDSFLFNGVDLVTPKTLKNGSELLLQSEKVSSTSNVANKRKTFENPTKVPSTKVSQNSLGTKGRKNKTVPLVKTKVLDKSEGDTSLPKTSEATASKTTGVK